MGTECSASQLEFGGLGKRAVVGVFDGGEIATDGGGLALRELEERVGILKRLGECFSDHRDPRRIEHRVETLVKQRVLGICLGYEDLNDHDELCRDRLLALLCDCEDVVGARRQRETDRGKPLAGKSTLNRLELTLAADAAAHRYKKIVADMAAMDALLVETFLEAHESKRSADPTFPWMSRLKLDTRLVERRFCGCRMVIRRVLAARASALAGCYGGERWKSGSELCRRVSRRHWRCARWRGGTGFRPASCRGDAAGRGATS